MQLVANEEQSILRGAADEFFAERLPIANLRSLRDGGDERGFDPAAWQEMAAMGWAGVLVSEAYGGSEFGYVGLGQILEAGGHTLACSPLLSNALVAAPLLGALGNDGQRQQLLMPLVAGESLAALALDEGPRHQPLCSTTRAERDGAGFVLNGQKTFVVDGHVADKLLVVATHEAGTGVFVVPADASGLQCLPTRLVDSRFAANLVLRDVRVGEDQLLGGLHDASTALERTLDGARAGVAAELLGLSLEAFERTLAYLRMREQFDQPIGSFQALKHRAALMFCELELTRSAVMAALSALDDDREDVAELASLAKAKACDTAELVTNEAVQMHGGIGMTDEEDIGLFMKRARVLQQLYGDGAFHRARYADLRGF